METITIKINNWEKYNARKDLKRMHWIRLEGMTIHDRKVRSLSPEGKWLWITILCMSALNRSGEFDTDFNELSHNSGLSLKHIKDNIKILQQASIVSLVSHEIAQNRAKSRELVSYITEHNRTEHNETEQNITEQGECNSSQLDAELPKFNSNSLFNLWNENCSLLPKAISLNKKRIQQINARIKEFPDVEMWIKAIRKLVDSKFCNGENDRGWKANFDFLIKPDSVLKIIEGRYDNSTSGGIKTKADYVSEANARLWKHYDDLEKEEEKNEIKDV